MLVNLAKSTVGRSKPRTQLWSFISESANFAYQYYIRQIWVINVTLIRSLPVLISRDCFHTAFLMVLCLFSLQTARSCGQRSTQDESSAGCVPCNGVGALLCGVWVPETVQMWGDHSMQSTRFNDLEENIAYQHHTPVSRQKLSLIVALYLSRWRWSVINADLLWFRTRFNHLLTEPTVGCITRFTSDKLVNLRFCTTFAS